MSNPTAQQAAPAAPPRYKLALISWAGAYGVITLILGLLGPTIAVWPLVLRTILISVLMTTALTWVVLPALTRLFREWLFAADDRSAPRPGPSTCPPGSRSWAQAGRAS
jgi:antibiotic biosynthesis monooxygenase (ABM) superfamily enzyme